MGASIGNLNFDKSIKTWDEGLPLGNGEQGCLVWGTHQKVNFSIDRGDVWDTSTHIEDDPNYNYPHLVELLKNKKFAEIAKIFSTPYHKATPTKLTTGRIELSLASQNKIEFNLDIEKAVAEIKTNNITVETFVHSTERIGMIKSSALALSLDIVNPKYGEKEISFFKRLFMGTKYHNKLKEIVYKKAEHFKKTILSQKGEIVVKYFIQKITESFSYGVFVATVGNCAAYFSATNKEKDWIEKSLGLLKKALEQGYDQLLVTHKLWWKKFWDKSSITIDNKKLEKGWYIGNYLLGSGSRLGHYPLPLQGLWTADDGINLPPWKGDYHNDLNTQLTYYSYLKSNHMEEGKCFVDFIISLTNRAKAFAKNVMKTRGLCLPTVMDLNGYAMGGWTSYTMSPTNHLWLCQTLERYYSYSNDMDFLKRACYPFIKESAECILGLMRKDERGKLILPWSSSPEIHNDSPSSYLYPNSNFDLSIITYIFTTLVDMSIKLNNTDTKRWKEVLTNLDDLAISKDKVLMLSRVEQLAESHRHHSHAMAIHPLRLIEYNNGTNKEIIESTIDNLKKLGTTAWTGYSFAWFAEFCVCAKNGNLAEEYLNKFYDAFCLPNGFHCNGDYKNIGYSDMKYRPFTLEGNFCAIDAVQEMLLYSEKAVLEIFPALPKEWENAEFETLRACGGLLVSAKYQEGKISYIKITAEKDYSFRILNDLSTLKSNSSETKGVYSLKANETLIIK